MNFEKSYLSLYFTAYESSFLVESNNDSTDSDNDDTQIMIIVSASVLLCIAAVVEIILYKCRRR